MPESDNAHRVDDALEGEIVDEGGAVAMFFDRLGHHGGVEGDAGGAGRGAASGGAGVRSRIAALVHYLALQGLVAAVGAVALGHMSLRPSGEGGAPPTPCRSLVVYRLEDVDPRRPPRRQDRRDHADD